MKVNGKPLSAAIVAEGVERLARGFHGCPLHGAAVAGALHTAEAAAAADQSGPASSRAGREAVREARSALRLVVVETFRAHARAGRCAR